MKNPSKNKNNLLDWILSRWIATSLEIRGKFLPCKLGQKWLSISWVFDAKEDGLVGLEVVGTWSNVLTTLLSVEDTSREFRFLLCWTTDRSTDTSWNVSTPDSANLTWVRWTSFLGVEGSENKAWWPPNLEISELTPESKSCNSVKNNDYPTSY